MWRALVLGLSVSCLLFLQSVAVEPCLGEPSTTFNLELDGNDKSGSISATELALPQLILIEQGLGNTIPALRPRDAMVLLVAIKDRVESLLAMGNTHPAFAKDSPASMAEFEKLFWDIHVYSNLMTSIVRYYEYATVLKSTALKYKPKAQEEIGVQISRFDWAKLKTDFEDLRARFEKRVGGLRIARVQLADKVLTESKDAGERLQAALVIDVDGELMLATASSAFDDAHRNIQTVIEHAKKSAGPEFINKARSLFLGLHWWFRGRYGAGSEGGGLLKDAGALKSHDLMFGLYMPVNPLEAVPQVDRRHHYLWRIESQRYQYNTTVTRTSEVEKKGIGVVILQRSFY